MVIEHQAVAVEVLVVRAGFASALLLSLVSGGCEDASPEGGDAGMGAQESSPDASPDDTEGGPDGGGDNPSDGDSGSEPDVEDSGSAESDSGACAQSCVHGSCEDDACTCDPGFSGALCDALNTPSEQGMLLWFDADHDDSFEIASFQQVASWTARMAVNGPVVTTADLDGHRPVRWDDQLNGRSTVIFDGANDSLSSDGDGFTFWDGLDGVDSYTLFAVYQATVKNQIAFAAISNAHALGIAVGTGGREGQVEALHGDATAAADVFPLQLVSQDNAIVLTDYNLVTLRVTQTAAILRVNGEEVATVALEDPIALNIEQAIINLGVDSIFYPESRYLGGALAEIILFSGGLSADSTEDVEDYLQAKWGL